MVGYLGKMSQNRNSQQRNEVARITTMIMLGRVSTLQRETKYALKKNTLGSNDYFLRCFS